MFDWIANILEMDEVEATKTDERQFEYNVLTGGIFSSICGLKAKIAVSLSPPVKRLKLEGIEEESGPIFKRYKVKLKGKTRR